MAYFLIHLIVEDYCGLEIPLVLDALVFSSVTLAYSFL